MSRPISWLPRLHEITRAVEHSIRSHYDRHDLEELFELQPRAAQKMLEMVRAHGLEESLQSDFQAPMSKDAAQGHGSRCALNSRRSL